MCGHELRRFFFGLLDLKFLFSLLPIKFILEKLYTVTAEVLALRAGIQFPLKSVFATHVFARDVRHFYAVAVSQVFVHIVHRTQYDLDRAVGMNVKGNL